MNPVRIVLDTSAVREYAAGSINVGEVIAEVADESAAFAVPLMCLAEAARQVSAESLSALYVLEAHKHGRIVADEAHRWRILAGLARVLGRTDLGSTLLAAKDHDAYILTAEPSSYGDPGRELTIRI